MVAFDKREEMLREINERANKLSVILSKAVPDGTEVVDVWMASSLMVYEALEQLGIADDEDFEDLMVAVLTVMAASVGCAVVAETKLNS